MLIIDSWEAKCSRLGHVLGMEVNSESESSWPAEFSCSRDCNDRELEEVLYIRFEVNRNRLYGLPRLPFHE